MGEGHGLGEQLARLAQQLHHALAGAERGQADELGVGGPPGVGEVLERARLGEHAAVAADDRARRQLQVAPPRDVGEVAPGRHHDEAGALVRLGEMVRVHGDLGAEDRRRHRGPHQVAVALVVGMRDEGHVGGDELRPGRVDLHHRSVRTVEGDPVHRARLLLVLELGLRHGGAERHVPQRRGLGLVRLAAGEVAQEGELRRAPRGLVDRPIGQRPVNGEPERAPERLELLLVLDGEPVAQLDEVAPRDRHLVGGLRARVVDALHGRHEALDVGQRGVAAHAVVVLHPSLGRQAVVVPAHRVEQVLAAHALEARGEVHVRVAEHVPDVQRARRRRRGRVDRVDRVAAGRERRLALEAVRALRLPDRRPLGFEAFEGGALGDGSRHGRLRIRCVRHRVSVQVPQMWDPESLPTCLVDPRWCSRTET